MAEKQTPADKADIAAHQAEVKVQEARQKATEDARTPEEKKVAEAEAKADAARADAALKRADEETVIEPTTAMQAKSLSALAEPDRLMGDHHAQKFSRTPENPQFAPGLDPDAEGKVKLTMVTSDTLAAGQPSVAYVHPEMVGDYLRAGWSRG